MRESRLAIPDISQKVLLIFSLLSAGPPAFAFDIGLNAVHKQLLIQSNLTATASEAGDRFGYSLAAGDYNGDGFVDLAIGSPQDDFAGASSVGLAHVLYSTYNGLQDGGQIWHQDSPGIPGDAEGNDQFATSLSAGDYNGDGFMDLAIGIPYEDGGTFNLTYDIGGVNIIYGSDQGLTATGSQGWTQDSAGVGGGTESGDKFGLSLTSGDFNNDGYDDLVIGVPYEDISDTPDAGIANVLYGTAAGLSATGSQVLDNSPQGTNSYDYFAWSLTTADFNGDGFMDLAVGVYGEEYYQMPSHHGTVKIYHGTADGLLRVQNWCQEDLMGAGTALVDEFFGYAIAAQDFNGDGYGDLAIGVPNEDVGSAADAGQVNIMYGTADGLAAAGNQAWTEDDIPNLTAEANNHFGNVLTAGDFNNDGYGDLAIGIPEKDYSGVTDSGMVTILYGTPQGLSAAVPQSWAQDSMCTANVVEAGDKFGAALAAGDFNNDGMDDLAVGLPWEDLNRTVDTYMAPYDSDDPDIKADAGIVHIIYSNLYVPAEFDIDGDGDVDGMDVALYSQKSGTDESFSRRSISWLAGNFGAKQIPDKVSLLARYAPMVWLAENEEFMPSSVDWAFQGFNRVFNQYGENEYSLRTIEDMASPEDASLELFAGNLGSAPVYAFWAAKDSCGHESVVDLVYYFYYPYNRGKYIGFPVNAWVENHVSDWEHITVRLQWNYDGENGWAMEPTLMNVSAHNFGGRYDWDDLDKVQETHPVVYAAKGSHGFWLEEGAYNYHTYVGVYDVYDVCTAGTAWNTWELMECFDYFDPANNLGQGLGESVWPTWMSADFTDPGDCGNEADPACGSIYRWGNHKWDEVLDITGAYYLTDAPTGPVSKSAWYFEMR